MFWQRLLLILACLTHAVSSAPTGNEHFRSFIKNVESLVMNTTDRALEVTKHVYLNLRRSMPKELVEATEDMIQSYIEQVDNALSRHAAYSEKRKLFQKFRQIEHLRQRLAPYEPEFQLISEQFYNSGKNCTVFDNLYLDFMKRFKQESMKLWENLSEQTVEQKEDLLEILDEIDKEKKLQEKDKLYDEFIEMFLFKNNEDRIENRELE